MALDMKQNEMFQLTTEAPKKIFKKMNKNNLYIPLS